MPEEATYPDVAMLGVRVPPNLGDLERTVQEEWAAFHFTAVSAVLVRNEPNAHLAWFVVGPQHFRLDGHYETKGEASFVCLQLAKAIADAIAAATGNT